MDKPTAIVAIAFILAGSLLVAFQIHQDGEVDREAIRAGLVQKMVPGTSRVIWEKPDAP